MKMYNPQRADDRPIEEKALSLIFAMPDEAATALHDKLMSMSQCGNTAGSMRAKMFCGNVLNSEAEAAA